MAIYKLNDVVDIMSGGTPKTSNEKYWNGTIQWISIKDIISSSKYINRTEKTITELGLENSSTKLLKRDDIIISARGTVGEVAMLKTPMAFNQSCFGLRAKQNIILSDYLFYWLKNNFSKINGVTQGSVFDTINLNSFNGISIDVPSVKIQQNLIDIIEPLERLISTLTKQRTTILKIIDSLSIPKSDSLVNFEIVKTGKRNANHESDEGKYNFYTCGQEVKKCDEYSFDGQYILLSGNANLYSWWYNGKFDLYQRVYALKPSKDFFTTYYSVQLALQKLRDESSGSVIKYIKLDDIYNIELYSNTYENILKPLYKCISKINNLLSHTTTVLEKQVKLLIK